MPICAHVAPSIVNVQSQCTGQPLDLVSAAGKALGLDHRDAFERRHSKIMYEAWDVGGVDIDVCTRFSCGFLARRRPTDPLGLQR